MTDREMTVLVLAYLGSSPFWIFIFALAGDLFDISLPQHFGYGLAMWMALGVLWFALVSGTGTVALKLFGGRD